MRRLFTKSTFIAYLGNGGSINVGTWPATSAVRSAFRDVTGHVPTRLMFLFPFTPRRGNAMLAQGNALGKRYRNIQSPERAALKAGRLIDNGI